MFTTLFATLLSAPAFASTSPGATVAFSQIVLSEEHSQATDDRFERLAAKRLETAGFNVVEERLVAELLFGEGAGHQARYVIAGVVDDFSGGVGGDSAVCRLSVDWEVLDRQTRRVVYSAHTVGSADGRGLELADVPVVDALLDAFTDVAGDVALVAAIGQAEPADSPIVGVQETWTPLSDDDLKPSEDWLRIDSNRRRARRLTVLGAGITLGGVLTLRPVLTGVGVSTLVVARAIRVTARIEKREIERQVLAERSVDLDNALASTERW